MDKVLSLIRHGIWSLSVLLFVFAWVCYWRRFDAVTAATVYPPWCWAIAGIALAGITLTSQRRAVVAAAVVFWLLFLLVFSDSLGSFVRTWLPAPTKEVNLRVISLNCAGDPSAAREAMTLGPDIILFQESPGLEDLQALAGEFFGPGNHVYWGGDASIVARGEITPVTIPPLLSDNFVHARVQLGARSVDVVSLRLLPSVFRMDLWAPSCWQDFLANRRARRSELEKIVGYVKTLSGGGPLILGGDFNASAGDAVFRVMPRELSDSFCEAGRGWGGTFSNWWPVIRIDRIWHTREVQPVSVASRKTQFSDHRMVVGSFYVESL